MNGFLTFEVNAGTGGQNVVFVELSQMGYRRFMFIVRKFELL